MTIGKIAHRHVDTALADETIQAAAQRMGTRLVGTLVVLDDDGHPIGMITDRDIAVRVVGQGRDPHRTTVRDVMTPDVQVAHENLEVEKALSLMRANTIRRLPVVDDQERLVGMVSLDDILTLLAREFRELGRLLNQEKPAVLRKA